jgi:predicted ferric reductase
MRNIRIALFGGLAVLTGLWLASDPKALQAASVFAVRATVAQYTGVLAMGCMSAAMILALRPRWPEGWLGGLDRMYRLHKWLGIGALSFSVAHWAVAKAPGWAMALGWLAPHGHRVRVLPDTFAARAAMLLHGPAEVAGEWVFYAAVVLIVLALVKRFPYGAFVNTHRILAAFYLVLVFHAVVLARPGYWLAPLGLALVPLLAAGTVAAVLVLQRRVGAGRRVRGTITALHTFPQARCTEVEVALDRGWRGHRAGQFAFVALVPGEGAHPYTIASAWPHSGGRLVFVIKQLGDHTRQLPGLLRVGQEVTVEGPYGRFTFEDARPHQIWVGGGIGITPFIARMKQLAAQPKPLAQTIDLFHTTVEEDPAALARLRRDAAAAGVRLHVLVDRRDGRLTAGRIRDAVPGWREASTWFCGPAGFGEALRRDFAGAGVPVRRRFHQELFAMR